MWILAQYCEWWIAEKSSWYRILWYHFAKSRNVISCWIYIHRILTNKMTLLQYIEPVVTFLVSPLLYFDFPTSCLRLAYDLQITFLWCKFYFPTTCIQQYNLLVFCIWVANDFIFPAMYQHKSVIISSINYVIIAAKEGNEIMVLLPLFHYWIEGQQVVALTLVV